VTDSAAIRTDLLALTEHALSSLTNRGLVKRAAKDLSAGAGPTIVVDADGTLHARFADGTDARLSPSAGLAEASCSCAAPGLCRHRIGLVLAYRQQFGDPPQTDTGATGFTAWSPADFDDEALTRTLGSRALTAARRTFSAGYQARVHRATAEDPVPWVELPLCTVKFLAPGDLGYASTDATGPLRDAAVVLAVWAFREAMRTAALSKDPIQIHVRDQASATVATTGIEPTLDLVDELLLDGAANSSAVLISTMRHLQSELEDSGLHWPAGALAELAEQLDWYHARAARYQARRFAELVTELHARQRASAAGDPGRRSRALGENEQGQAPLRRVRLVGLGCRITGTAEDRVADVYFAHPDNAAVLVLRRRWELTEEQLPPTGYELSSRRIAGSTLAALSVANLVSESASRGADRQIRIAAGRIAKTSVTPVGDAWRNLPAQVVVRDLAAAARTLADLPPRLVRPRVEAEFVRVVEVCEVRDIGYDPATQQLQAVVADAAGAVAILGAAYRSTSPGALDALAEALAGPASAEEPLLVSGTLSRSHGTLRINPVAVLTPTCIVVPDLAPGDGSGGLSALREHARDPLGAALDDALLTLADAAHTGVRHVRTGVSAQLSDCAEQLARAGLRHAAALLSAFTSARQSDDTQLLISAWVDAQLHLITCMESL